MAILGIQRPEPGGTYQVPTEIAVTGFGLLAGVGGALAQIIASRRLSTITGETIPARRLLLATGLGAIGSVAGAFLVPSGG